MNKTVYEKAIDYIKVHGWCQGNFVNREKQVCLVGALNVVAETGFEMQNAIDSLTKKLKIEKGNLAVWNDEVGRTKKDVINLLEEMQL